MSKHFDFEEPTHQSLVGIEIESETYNKIGLPFSVAASRQQKEDYGRLVAFRVSREAFNTKVKPQKYYMEAMIARRLE